MHHVSVHLVCISGIYINTERNTLPNKPSPTHPTYSLYSSILHRLKWLHFIVPLPCRPYHCSTHRNNDCNARAPSVRCGAVTSKYLLKDWPPMKSYSYTGNQDVQGKRCPDGISHKTDSPYIYHGLSFSLHRKTSDSLGKYSHHQPQ